MYSRKNNNLKYKKSSLWQKRKVIKILTRFGHFKNWDFPIFIEIVIEEASGRSEYCIRINLLNSKRVLSNWLCWPRSIEPNLNHLKIKFQNNLYTWLYRQKAGITSICPWKALAKTIKSSFRKYTISFPHWNTFSFRVIDNF